MRVRHVLPLALSTALISGGCANLVEAVGRTQDSRILNPDGVQGDRRRIAPMGPQKTAQGETRSATPLMEEATGRLRGDRACLDGDDGGSDFTFFCRQSQSENNTGNSSAARKYLAAGLTLSNELCDAWFSRLQVTQVTLRQSSDVISSVGSVTAAIMGFTGTPAKTIGLTASLFGAGKQANDTLAANYIVAVDLTSVASAVREYRALYAQQIEQSQAGWNYYTARRVVMAYDNTCSAIFVRRFVNARVEGGAGDSDEVEPLLEAAIAGFVAESGKYFPKPLNVAQLVDLYVYLYLPDTPKPTRDKIVEGLRTDGLVTDEGVAFKKNPQGEPVATALSLSRLLINTNIDAAIKSRARARVESMRAILAADAENKVKTAQAAERKAEDEARNAAVLEAQAEIAEGAAVKAETAAAAARAKVTALSAEAVAANAPATQALYNDANTAETKARAARSTANEAMAKARGASKIAANADADSDKAAVAASGAQAAVAGAGTGTSEEALEAERAAVPVPAGANGRPLDAAPKP